MGDNEQIVVDVVLQPQQQWSGTSRLLWDPHSLHTFNEKPQGCNHVPPLLLALRRTDKLLGSKSISDLALAQLWTDVPFCFATMWRAARCRATKQAWERSWTRCSCAVERMMGVRARLKHQRTEGSTGLTSELSTSAAMFMLLLVPLLHTNSIGLVSASHTSEATTQSSRSPEQRPWRCHKPACFSWNTCGEVLISQTFFLLPTRCLAPRAGTFVPLRDTLTKSHVRFRRAVRVLFVSSTLDIPPPNSDVGSGCYLAWEQDELQLPHCAA